MYSTRCHCVSKWQVNEMQSVYDVRVVVRPKSLLWDLFVYTHTTHREREKENKQWSTQRGRIALRFGICRHGISSAIRAKCSMLAVVGVCTVFKYSRINSLYVRHCIRASTITYFIFICVFRSNICSNANVPLPEPYASSSFSLSPSPIWEVRVSCAFYGKVNKRLMSGVRVCVCLLDTRNRLPSPLCANNAIYTRTESWSWRCTHTHSSHNTANVDKFEWIKVRKPKASWASYSAATHNFITVCKADRMRKGIMRAWNGILYGNYLDYSSISPYTQERFTRQNDTIRNHH